jgi:serine/threonine protein kinase
LAIKGILHRDLSHNNVLVKIHDEGAVTVKLSDFGLHKTQSSNLTQTGTAMKGTIIDPMLTGFKSYSLINEIYSVGRVVSYIFTGRQEPKLDGALGQVVKRCVDLDLTARYKTIPDIIRDVETLQVLSR